MWCNHSLKCTALWEYFQLQKKIKCTAFINVMLHISSDQQKKKKMERKTKKKELEGIRGINWDWQVHYPLFFWNMNTKWLEDVIDG